MSEKKRWVLVSLFGMAMAWLESATVAYLRTFVDRIEPYQPNPLPMTPGLGEAELVREAATLLMLFTVGWLAGKTWRARVGYFLIAFGVWDIFYYVFLKIITGWPHSMWDWDILFLIPLPWWGPVIAPVIIAALMIFCGTLVTQFDYSAQTIWPQRWTWALNLSGVALALFVFMVEAIRALPDGTEAIRNTLPHRFNWLLFLLAVTLIAAPIGDAIIQIWRKRRQRMALPSGKVNFSVHSLFMILLYKIISHDT